MAIAQGFDSAAVDASALPERLASPDGRSQEDLDAGLLRARNLLYVDVWEQFSAELDCSIQDIVGLRGEVFANFRGFVTSTDGLEDDGARKYVPNRSQTGYLGTFPFDSFSRDPKFRS